MASSVMIRQDHTDIPYGMRFYFSLESEKWILSFDSAKSSVIHHEEHAYNTFEEVRRHFINNCKYYNVEVPKLPETEEEFFGVPAGTIYPGSVQSKSPASHAASRTSFNYLEARNVINNS